MRTAELAGEVGWRRTDLLEPLARKVGGWAIAADLTDRDSIFESLARAGAVDVLVADAALPAIGLLDEFRLDETDRALEVNLGAPIMMAELVALDMIARCRGHLVFISSLSGMTASVRSSLYNATKFGPRGFALGLRADLRPHHVGVSIVFPGYISDAGHVRQFPCEAPPGIGARSPRDVARATARAIEQNTAEVAVAPPGLRLLGAVARGLTAAIQRGVGTEQVTR
ncbi:SDR family oxidoreductase [Nocardia inohanensis]|uniref:SDR family oxidoreductase n=1 Tax=Nocardia inohanensis TaxID=209246 RepID=UPI000A97AEA1|nr:SDR family NAD(P)-dependent oxidoreductase [Nocardia inohanensis]